MRTEARKALSPPPQQSGPMCDNYHGVATIVCGTPAKQKTINTPLKGKSSEHHQIESKIDTNFDSKCLFIKN